MAAKKKAKEKVEKVEKKPTIVCPNCQNEVEEGLPFCRVCGGKMPEKIACPKCGVMHYSNTYCPGCGYKKKSHKGLIITLSIIGALLIIGLTILIIVLAGGSNSNSNGGGNSGGNSGSPTQPTQPKKQVSIKASETKAIEYQTFNNGIVSMKIPKGWKVETMGDNIHYGIRVYNPNDARYQIFMYLKMEPFLTNTQAKSIYSSFYAQSGGDKDYGMLASCTALKGTSTAGFYESFMDHVGFIKGTYGSQFYSNSANHTFPVMYNLKTLDQIAPVQSGGGQFESILRLNFTVPLATGEELVGQGLFTASVMPAASIQKVNGVDVTPRLVYEVSGVSSAEEDFTSWEPILLECLRSLTYSDSFIKATQELSIAQGQAARDANKQIQAAYDSYNNAWSQRQKSYDVASQKRSDATLSYDRVKDPDTGEIYRAEVGWYDSYNINRDSYNKTNLQLVTSDSDYLEPVSGYIYK